MYGNDIPAPDPSAKVKAYDVESYGEAMTSGPNPNYRRPSPLEEMEKHLAHHDESFTRISKGTTFLREHPEFNEFIQLIRTGSISI